VETRHHRADRDVQDLRDLLVGEAFHVGQEHRHPELLGKAGQGLLDVLVGKRLEDLCLRGGLGAVATETLVEVPLGDLLIRDRLRLVPSRNVPNPRYARR
jgi:hypothetical protein